MTRECEVGSESRRRAGRCVRRIRFSAARYSHWRSRRWFTSPVSTHLLSCMTNQHGTPSGETVRDGYFDLMGMIPELFTTTSMVPKAFTASSNKCSTSAAFPTSALAKAVEFGELDDPNTAALHGCVFASQICEFIGEVLTREGPEGSRLAHPLRAFENKTAIRLRSRREKPGDR